MKHSIRVRFTMIFIGLMAAVLLTLWAVNSFFLEGFYTNEKLKLLEEVYDKLNEFVVEKAENGENIIDDLQSLYSRTGSRPRPAACSG